MELHNISSSTTTASSKRNSLGTCIVERDALPPLFRQGERLGHSFELQLPQLRLMPPQPTLPPLPPAPLLLMSLMSLLQFPLLLVLLFVSAC